MAKTNEPARNTGNKAAAHKAPAKSDTKATAAAASKPAAARPDPRPDAKSANDTARAEAKRDGNGKGGPAINDATEKNKADARNSPASHAAKSTGDNGPNSHETRADEDAKQLSPDQQLLADGEHITQNKPTIGEAMAGGTGGAATMESIGEGSVEELAPAVRSAVSDKDRIVQQGDEVMVHGRTIIDGQTTMQGVVLKVNQDSSIAVRVPRSNGTTYDVPGKVHNSDLGTGEWYWTWPDKDEDKSSKRA